jgi:hypothetical protein
MTSTRPLAKTGSDIERLLLSAGAEERPDVESVRKAARGLGLVPRAALVAATLGLALRAGRWTSLAAWGSMALVGASGIAMVAYAVRSSPPAGAALLAAQHPPGALVLPQLVSPPSRADDSLTTARATGEPAALAPDAHQAPRRVASSPSAQADRLRAEAQALDAARERLARGDATGALVELGDYDRRFAGGSLREEALLLRIESLARVGDGAAATTFARRFLKAYPTSVHVDRVAALLRELEPRTP